MAKPLGNEYFLYLILVSVVFCIYTYNAIPVWIQRKGVLLNISSSWLLLTCLVKQIKYSTNCITRGCNKRLLLT